MRKLISGIIVLLLMASVLFVAVTYRFGVKTEQQYHILLQQASQAQHAPYLKFVNESYSRGVFASKAQTVMEIEHPLIAAEEKAPIRFILSHEITHGPFPLSRSPEGKRQFKPLMAIIETGIDLGPDSHGRLTKFFGQIPETVSMRDYTIIYPDGNGEEHFVIPAFQHTYGDEDKVVVDWKGLFFQVNFTADLKGFTGSMSIPGLEVAGKDLDLKINDMKYVFNAHQGIEGLWLGEASFELADLDFAQKEGTERHTVLTHGISAHTSGNTSGENVSYLLALRTDRVKLDESQYGPGVFKMEIRNIDAPSLAKLQQTAREMYTPSSQHSPEEAQRIVLSNYLQMLPALLKKSPELEITQIDLKTTDGDFAGTARIAVDGTTWEAHQDLSKLATTLTAKAEMKAGERLVKRVVSSMMKSNILAETKKGYTPGDEEVEAMASTMAEQQLNALTAQNVLVKESGSYKANASYNAGQIVLNGRPLPLENFMQ